MIHEPKLDVILVALRERLHIDIPQARSDEAPDHYKLSVEAKNATRQKGKKNKAVAVIPIFDTLVHRHAMMQSESGMTSYLYIRNAFRTAMANKDIAATVLHFDTSGGEGSGLFDLTDEIYNARGIKPIIAFIDERAFSAGYSLASAADMVIVPRTGGTGSIGVIMRHANLEKFNENRGIEYTTLYAGARKNDFSSDGPLTEEAYAVAKKLLNYNYDLFVKTVARNRGLTEEHIRGTEAALYWGQEAIDVGIADKIGTFDDAIDEALSASGKGARNISTKGILPGKENTMERFETLAALEAEYPEFAEQLREEGKKTVNIEEAVNTAVIAETDRIIGLAGIHFGDEAGEKFQAVVASGISVEQYRTVIPEGSTPAQSGESKLMEKMLEAITTETGQKTVGTGGEEQPIDFMGLVEEYREQHKCKKADAMKAIAKQYPDAHAAYLETLQPQGNA
jgi:signal peptide peptidase SppA